MPSDNFLDAAALVHDLVEVAGVLAGRADAATKLTQLCASAVRTIGCDRSSIFLVEDGVYRARCNHGNPPDIAAVFPQHRVRLGDPLVASAVARRSFVIVNDAATDPLMNPRVAAAARIQAIVVVPLFADDGESAGFMTAEYNERPGAFTPLSSTLLLGLAKLGETVLHAEREAAEQAELRRQLEVASRLDAINRLAAGVAHDLTNQLTAVLGAASLLVARDPDVGRLLEAAETAQQLGRRLLGVGREQPPATLPPLDLSATVLGAADRFRQFAPRHVLRFDVEPDLHVACSTTDLEQTLTNLVLNASDAAPPGTEIVVSLVARPAADGAAGPVAALSVSDRGTGIEPDLIDRIFEPFFTTKGTGSGTGLGLSSVGSIAASLGGTVAVDSAPGAGTTVTVSLPLVAPADRPATPPTRAPAGAGATVLVVDDTRVVLDATAAMLSVAGYAVRAAGSGEEALADPSGLADVTALVTDWTMPGMSGLELARRVRAQRPELPVVLVSGIPVDPALCDLPGPGPMTFLVKPFGPKDLLGALAELAGR